MKQEEIMGSPIPPKNHDEVLKEINDIKTQIALEHNPFKKLKLKSELHTKQSELVQSDPGKVSAQSRPF